jgi:hypothetical protein
VSGREASQRTVCAGADHHEVLGLPCNDVLKDGENVGVAASRGNEENSQIT